MATIDELNEWSEDFERRMRIDRSSYGVQVRILASKTQVRISQVWGLKLCPDLRAFEYWFDCYGPGMVQAALNATARKIRNKMLYPMDAEGVTRYTSGVLRKMASGEPLEAKRQWYPERRKSNKKTA
jgi:hypothetical protein